MGSLDDDKRAHFVSNSLPMATCWSIGQKGAHIKGHLLQRKRDTFQSKKRNLSYSKGELIRGEKGHSYKNLKKGKG